MNLHRVVQFIAILSCGSFTACTAPGSSTGTEQDARTTPSPRAEPAGSPGFFDRARSLFDGRDKKPNDQNTVAVAPSSNGIGKIEDIKEVFEKSAQEFDPKCTSLVKPFNVTDNALSLGMLMAKMQAQELMDRLGGATPRQNMAQTVRMAGKNLNWLPMTTERMLGERIHQQQLDKLLDSERKSNQEVIERARSMLEGLVQQIKDPTPYRFEVYVRRSTGNAQALPGGFIYIDRDLVANPKNADKANFALAHELAHVLQRHETRAIQARLTDTVDSFDGLRKIVDSATGNPNSLLSYSNAVMGRFDKFSQAQELQADACAVRLLNNIYPDPKRLATVIQSFKASLGPPQASEGPPSNQLEVFTGNMDKMGMLDDQHPNSRARAANLDLMLAEVSKPQKTATDTKAPSQVKIIRN